MLRDEHNLARSVFSLKINQTDQVSYFYKPKFIYLYNLTKINTNLVN